MRVRHARRLSRLMFPITCTLHLTLCPLYIRAYLCNYIYYVYLITQIWVLYMNISAFIGTEHINSRHATWDICCVFSWKRLTLPTTPLKWVTFSRSMGVSCFATSLPDERVFWNPIKEQVWGDGSFSISLWWAFLWKYTAFGQGHH